MHDTMFIQSALWGVTAVVAILAACLLTFRTASVVGWSPAAAVGVAIPPGFLLLPWLLWKTWKNPLPSWKSRGGSIPAKGPLGVLHIAAILLGVVCNAVGGLAIWWMTKTFFDLSHESLQIPILAGMLLASLIVGAVFAFWIRRIGFLEALWTTTIFMAILSLFPQLVESLFSMGTSPAYFVVIFGVVAGLMILSMILGGSLGFLWFGDGRLENRWGYERFVGLRFLMGKRSDSVVGTISIISVLAVAVGTCAMIVVLSVMNGFSSDLRAKIFGSNAHIMLTEYGKGLANYEQVIEKTKTIQGISGVSPFILNEVMISSENNLTGAIVKGIDLKTVDSIMTLRTTMKQGQLEHLAHPERIAQPLSKKSAGITETNSPLDAAIAAATAGVGTHSQGGSLPGIVIGESMSQSLRVFVGDTLNVVSPASELGPSGIIPKSKVFRVAGIFHSGMYEYDSKFAYIDLSVAQNFAGIGAAVGGLEYKIDDVDNASSVAYKIEERLGGYPYRAKDWMEMNRNIFSALKMEKVAMFIILAFITMVASFLIAATLIVFVIEKAKEIAILKTMGATDTGIMRIFVTYGVTVGAVGTVLGACAGLAVCLAMQKLGVGMDPNIYYLDHLPIKVDAVEVTLVLVSTLFLSFLATIYPSLMAARLQPVEGLRYS